MDVEPLQTAEGSDYPCCRQLAIFLENRVGQLLRIMRLLEDEPVRILGLSADASVDCAILRMLVNDPDLAREILGDAHDIVIEKNSIRARRDRPSAGVYVAASAGPIFLADNSFADCDERTGQGAFTDRRPVFECGCQAEAPQPRWLGPS